METPVAHTITSLRARLGLSQRELAEIATAYLEKQQPGSRVSIMTVCRLEAGGRVVLDHAEAIAAGLGVTVDALIAAQKTQRGLRAARPGAKRSHRKRVA